VLVNTLIIVYENIRFDKSYFTIYKLPFTAKMYIKLHLVSFKTIETFDTMKVYCCENINKQGLSAVVTKDPDRK